MNEATPGRGRRGLSGEREILATLGELRAQNSALIEGQNRDARAASESRAKMHARLDGISGQVGKVEARQSLLEARIERLEPIADQVSRQVGDWKAQRNALLWVCGAVAALGTFAVTMGNLIASLFKGWAPPG